MSGHAVESEFRRLIRESAAHRHFIAVAGMPMQDGVDVAKQSIADHIHFTAPAFFSRGAKYLNSSIQFFLLNQLLQLNPRSYTCCPKQVVSATMTRTLARNWFSLERCILGKAG